jgi:hypothetical protein
MGHLEILHLEFRISRITGSAECVNVGVRSHNYEAVNMQRVSLNFNKLRDEYKYWE